MSRHQILPSRGTLLVGADLHGNLDDLSRLQSLFLAEPDAHLLLLGDLVHGPAGWIREHDPALYDFEDRSFEVVQRVHALRQAHPGRVHLVLGNHDHSHVGGEHTSKFHTDEAAHLESSLTPGQRELLREVFSNALLLAMAPCGVALTHGSPDDSLVDLEQLERLSLEVEHNNDADAHLLQCWLQSYGQRGPVTRRLLAVLSRCSGLDLRLLVHGHDRDEEGYFVENSNQICPVIFGAPRPNKRYLHLDLSARYQAAADLREEHEIRRLYDM